MDQREFDNEWAIVTAGPNKYIGCITPFTSVNEVLDGTKKWLFLNPALDYIVLSQVQGGQLQKVPVLTPLESTLGEGYIHVQPTAVLLFRDMEETDRKRYKDMVEKTMNQVKEAQLKEKTGLIITKQFPQ